MPKKTLNVGLKDNKLKSCDKKYCCVSTQSEKSNKYNYIEPIHYEGSQKEALDKIIAIINSLKRTKILKQTDEYIHSIFITFLFRFKDDVEFYFDDNEKVIHFKSQSRLSGYDYHTNRKRMEKIRALFLQN